MEGTRWDPKHDHRNRWRGNVNILFATSNPHKIEEVEAILAPHGITVASLADLESIPPEPVEDAETFEGNARLKAIGYARATGQRCLADDSGLEVDALDGAPGVYSARYSGVEGPRSVRDAANNKRLLNEIESIPQERRTARFVCAMCLADPDGTIIAESRGHFEGLITTEPQGQNGFGYDPLLWLPEDRCTSAQLSPEEKNRRSHRGSATRALLDRLS
ncbi:MAG: non-canonical purine NTP pyrophosphatase, RdgB/HAM1 family [Phycisphaerae bacterium]|nr:non-canonical purine NTP pyrophosphatase, RdgB/HAM1 family [Phycisphaerae bacterium]